MSTHADPYDQYIEAMNLWWSEDRDPAYLSDPWKIAFNAGAAFARREAVDAASGPKEDA